MPCLISVSDRHDVCVNAVFSCKFCFLSCLTVSHQKLIDLIYFQFSDLKSAIINVLFILSNDAFS